MENNVELFKNYILNTIEDSSNNKFSNISTFWKNEHKRFNFENMFDFIPNIEEIDNLRIWDKRKAMGNGYPSKQYEWCAKSIFRLMTSGIPLKSLIEFTNNLKESNFGNPIKFETSFGNLSGMFYLNLISTYYIYTNIHKYYPNNYNLDICEIGTGWGQCCEILNQKFTLNSYTSIDLKETLILSYLNGCFNYNNTDIKLINDSEFKKFNYCIPENIQYFTNKEQLFDIFINWYSFQEMTIENVINYVEFIKTNLKINGLFISSNSWGGPYEIREFSDLQLHNFEIINIFKDGRSLINGNKQLVVVCKNTKNNKKIDIDKLNQNALLLRDTDTLTTEEFLKNIYN